MIGDYQLRLGFDDGLIRDVDLSGVVGGEGVFAPLTDPRYFAHVRIDAAVGTIVWPNDADLSPGFLHGDFDPEHSASK